MADDGKVRIWRLTGIALTAVAWGLGIVTQAVAHDFLPPKISVSQYGVGPHGWVFTCWMLAIALACGALYLARPARGRAAAGWLGAGMTGTAVMALVRTDPGGLQQSVNAKVHLAGAVLTVAAIPIGICLALRPASRAWARVAVVLTAASAVAFALLLLAAAGFRTAGEPAPESWAFWQGVSVVLDMSLLATFAAGVGFARAPGAVAPVSAGRRDSPG